MCFLAYPLPLLISFSKPHQVTGFLQSLIRAFALTLTTVEKLALGEAMKERIWHLPPPSGRLLLPNPNRSSLTVSNLQEDGIKDSIGSNYSDLFLFEMRGKGWATLLKRFPRGYSDILGHTIHETALGWRLFSNSLVYETKFTMSFLRSRHQTYNSNYNI